MAHETATLAAYVANLKFEDIPHEVRERAKALTLDFLGSAIRARRDAESTPSLVKMLEALALDGSGESTVFGDTRTWTPAVAALLNGALGHSLDFDDTHADSSLHPSAPVVPAAFAVSEMVGASGRDVLTAIVAGYEVCCRLGNALDPTSHYARGFHPTATAGVQVLASPNTVDWPLPSSASASSILSSDGVDSASRRARMALPRKSSVRTLARSSTSCGMCSNFRLAT